MRMRWVAYGGIGVVVAFGIAYAVPATRYPMLGYLHIERLYDGRPVGYWIGELKANDPQVRRQAALKLGDAGVSNEPPSEAEAQAVLAALIEAMGDADGFVRKCAATSFLMYPKEAAVSPAAVKTLTGALGDPEVAVRQAAMRALWQAGAPIKEEVARLAEALRDKDDYVRAYACRALGKIGPDAKEAGPTLLEVLRQDEDRDVRKLAAKSLGLIGPQALGTLRADAVAALTKALKDESPGLRDYAARALGQLDAREAMPALRQAALDKDQRVRAGVAEALKRLESADAEK